MNPNVLPPLAASLRKLGNFANRHEVNDATLAAVAVELDRARALVAQARGSQRANRCQRHPGGPVDPTATNGCLLCGAQQRRPAAPPPEGVTPAEVLHFAEQHGHRAAAARFGGRALARAVAIGSHPSSSRRSPAAGTPQHEQGDTA